MTDTPSNDLPQLPVPIKWLLQGALRHAMVGLGTALVTAHVLVGQQEQEFESWAISSILIVAGLGWSYISQRAKSSADAQLKAEGN